MRKAINLIRSPIEYRNAYHSKYLTHAISTWNHASSNASNDDNRITKEELIRFSCEIINMLIIYERREEAYAFASQILEFLKKIKEKENLSVSNIEQNSAPGLVRDNVFKEIYEQTIDILGREHHSSTWVGCEMALVLKSQGKYEDALGIYRMVLDILEHAFGKEHPNTLMTRHNMASVLDKQGKYEEALGIYREVLDIRERVLGKEHPYTLTTKRNIDLLLDKQCKNENKRGIRQWFLKLKRLF